MINLRDRLSSFQDDWLYGLDHRELLRAIDRCCLRINASDIVLIAEADPLKFIAAFIAAVSKNAVVILTNPRWGQQEWEQVAGLVRPDVVFGIAGPLNPPILGDFETSLARKPPSIGGLGGGDILIPTGGTSGQIRFAIHSWETLTASVEGFREYFGVDRINSCCVLPLYHVSGLMQLWRSLMTSGRLAICDWKALEAGVFPKIDRDRFFLSLVPTQLQRLLNYPELSQFRTILLGGAPAWESLLAEGRSRWLAIAPTYGMTETASQVATLKPEAFLRGQTGCGMVLPHAVITIRDTEGKPLPTGVSGLVTVEARSLMRGYFPPGPLELDDIGYFDEQHSLHIVGRNSQKIISGGENLYPAEIEAAIRSTGLVEDVCVIGVPDENWGEIVVAFYVSSQTVEELQGAIAALLSGPKLPKRWVAVEAIPRTGQGKIVRSRLGLDS
ncbi:MAG: 2-succinylbenzoate--CoA ligase [Alkalinema sp. RU_4_3]|nr:2-succinylbenzoate--CoA ligase [Alkalinema sp. RU_4_3]